MNILDYIASETERQSGTVREGLGMYFAWKHLVEHIDHEGMHIPEGTITWLQHLIKGGPEGYRETEVTFRNMSYPPVPADSVPQAMKRFGEQLTSTPFILDKRQYAYYMAREFLIIHPFPDGNGRVASLLWNALNETLYTPTPLPYFFGEN